MRFFYILLIAQMGLQSGWAGEGAAFRAGITRSGAHNRKGVPALTGLKWKFDCGGPVKSSPVRFKDTVYIGGPKGLHAIDAKGGQQKWLTPIPAGVESSVCIYNGIVYVGGMDSSVYAINASDGSIKWKKQVVWEGGNYIQSAPAVAYGLVFVHLEFKRVVGLDLETGEEKWVSRFDGSPPAAHAAVTLTDKYVVFGKKASDYSSVLDLETGKQSLMPGSGGYYTLATTAVDENNIAYVPQSGIGGMGYAALVAVDLNNLRHAWPKRYRFIEEDVEKSKRAAMYASPAVWGGKVFIGNDSGTFFAFSTKNGDPLWSVPGKGNFRSSASIAKKSGLLFVGNDDQHLYAFRCNDGTEVWKFKTNGSIFSSPWVSDGVIYVGSDDGFLYALQ